MPPIAASATSDGLVLKAYRGDGSALLAFDVPEELAPDLAGFAVRCRPPRGRPFWLLNRLSFAQSITSATTPEQRRWTPSKDAPFQKFRWAHYPPDVREGTYEYEATAMLFKPGSDSELAGGPKTAVGLELATDEYSRFEAGFTRGYLSSQAYAQRFDNAPFAPASRPLEYDTAPFERRYTWLGHHARSLLFGFLREALVDPAVTLDVFAYDLDEPDIVRALKQLGDRLRIFVDDSAPHREARSLTKKAQDALVASAGDANVKRGHFRRLAHNKVLIMKRDGRPVKVLTGSANFSVRGLYVQSNSILVFDHEPTARLYARAFEQAWSGAAAFDSSTIARRWYPVRGAGIPPTAVSFAPHDAAEVSLRRVADAIDDARSSVFFSVMELGSGTGRVMEKLRALASRTDVVALGTTQRLSGDLKVVTPGARRGVIVPFSYLSKKVPQPFRKEWSGGMGQVIHHKFVIVDFNDLRPVVFCGSSNLAAGGEESNSDNLLAITDRSIATEYAVEAVRLVDHYRFRAVMQQATRAEPLQLKTRTQQWWRDYYRAGHVKQTERLLLAR